MMWLREHWKIVALSALHALLLAFLTLVWMNLSWEFGDEVIVARINQIARYEIINPKNKVVEQFKKDLVLVNTSYDKTLIDYEDDYGAGNKPVTDRKKLSDFFKVINQSGQRPSLVVVDIIFDNPSPDDSLLTNQLRKIDNLVISSELGKDGKPVMPWPGLNFALAQYQTTTGMFLKYNLISDTVHYLPTAMYYETQGIRFREWGGVARSDPGWWLNSFIVDLPVRKAHIDNGEVLMWNLGEALSFPPEDVQNLVANKIIIVGDIHEYDIHQTLLGQQPGPLIVANAYLGMLQGIPRIKLLDGFLIFVMYFLSTMYVLHWRRHKEKLMIIPGRLKFGKFAVGYLTYILVFSLYSIFLYLLTSRHFQLLIFGLYFNLFEYLVNRYGPKVAEHTLIPEVSNVD
jgi:CHASE2 domain-containing sensor protein